MQFLNFGGKKVREKIEIIKVFGDRVTHLNDFDNEN